MNRRTILWAVPAVLAASAAPAYASSGHSADRHTCHPRECRPQITAHRRKHPSGKSWWEYTAKSPCGFGHVHKVEPSRTEKRERVSVVVWTPYDRGRPQSYRTEAARNRGAHR